MNDTINKIYKSQEVTTLGGKIVPLNSAISQEEGNMLFSIIHEDPTIRNTIEVGCAYGLSSMHICEATRERENASHVIIDPFQMTQWDGIGIANLAAAGLSRYRLIERKSEFALPEIVERSEEGFDFVFIDGWHTFDHTLIDCFYATRLLRVGGYLVVDDVDLPAIRRVVDYLLNYPCYEFFRAFSSSRPASLKKRLARMLFRPMPNGLMGKVFSKPLIGRLNLSSQSMVALKKVAADDRDWDWHSDKF